MKTVSPFSPVSAALRREWLLLALVAGGLWIGAGWMVWAGMGSTPALIFGLVSGGILVYQLTHLYRHLRANHPLQECAAVFPNLGAANWITMLRAFMLAFLAAFVFLPRPDGWLAWAPGTLYMTAALLDYLDGGVARLTRRSSRLGEILDMHWDGFGMLAAATLLVLYGQVPPWFLVIGLARYLYLFGIWVRQRKGLPVYELPPNIFRRALAGTQMGFVAVVLLPVFRPPATWVAALFFALPFLLGFLRDWFFVSGVLNPDAARARPERWMRLWGPTALRLLLVMMLAFFMLEQIGAYRVAPGIFIVGIPALLALILGAAGRFFSMMVLLMCGFILQILPFDWRVWTLMLLSTAVLTFGTGRFSLWKPEEWLIYHRLGDVEKPG